MSETITITKDYVYKLFYPFETESTFAEFTANAFAVPNKLAKANAVNAIMVNIDTLNLEKEEIKKKMTEELIGYIDQAKQKNLKCQENIGRQLDRLTDIATNRLTDLSINRRPLIPFPTMSCHKHNIERLFPASRDAYNNDDTHRNTENLITCPTCDLYTEIADRIKKDEVPETGLGVLCCQFHHYVIEQMSSIHITYNAVYYGKDNYRYYYYVIQNINHKSQI